MSSQDDLTKLDEMIRERRHGNDDKELSVQEATYLFAKYLRRMNKDMSYEQSVNIAKKSAFRVQTKKDLKKLQGI